MAEKDDNNNDNNEYAKNTAEPLLSLKRCKEWLEQQKLDYESELNCMRKIQKEDLEGDDKEPDIEELCDSIAQLEKQLLEVSLAISTKRCVLERLLTSYVKMKMLFETKEETEEQVPSEKEFASQVNEQQTLCRDVQKYKQALEEEEDILRGLERERIETTTLNEKLRRKLQELQTRKQTGKTEKESKKESSLRQQILERQNMIEVARNICQALIFGSGVDWSADKELRELVLSCGQPINLLDT